MALDFPTSPTNGQKFPASPIAGVPTYTWDSEKWTTKADAIAAAEPHVKIAGDTMTGALALPGNPAAALQAVPKQYVDTFAAPFEAMAYSGMQINGSMEVSQELPGGISGIANTLKYFLDGWNCQTVGAQIVTLSAPGVGPPGFGACAQILVSTANASPSATDVCMFNQRIEGYRVAKLAWGTANAQPITIGFWVYAVRPGNYSGSVFNSAVDRSYPFPFTVNTTNTWEYKTATIPGDTTGTWLKTNGTGLNASITMMAGSSRQAPANVWAAGTVFGVTGTINGVAATTDYMLLTGVTVLPGTQAPSAARSPFIMRPYDQELVTCKRYWQKSYDYPTALGAANQVASVVTTAVTGYTLSLGSVPFQTDMRSSPSVTVYTPNNGTAGWLADFTGGDAFSANRQVQTLYPSTKNFFVVGTVGDFTTNTNKRFHWSADARL